MAVGAGAGGKDGADQSMQTCDMRQEGGTLDVGHWMTDGAPSNGALSPALVQTLRALFSRANIDSWEDSSLNKNFRLATLGEEKIPSAVWWQQFNPP